jgi:hypothetical protein
MPHYFVLLLLALLTLFSGSSEAATISPPPQSTELGESVVLRRNAPVAIDENVVVAFEEILTDGRCPAQLLEGSDRPVMMQCTASLPVEVVISVRRGDTVERLTFRVDTDTLGNVTADVAGTNPVQRSGAHLITLEQVLPYPMVDRVRDDSAATVTLRVTRAEGQGPVTAAPASIPARLGEPTTLAIGQTAVFQPGGMKAAVAGITDDRCPASTPCNEIAIVVVDLDVQVDAKTTRVSVGGVTDASGRVTGPLMETRGIPWARVGDYTIELLAVTPYPQRSGPAAPGDFAVTLVVTAREQGQPTPPAATPTAIPTAVSDVPVLSFDAAGNAVLCVSERALVELAAGASDQAPAQGTPLPLGAVSLPTTAAGNEICTMFFGAGWRIATMDDLTMSFADYLPATGVYWVWDDAVGAAVPWPAE